MAEQVLTARQMAQAEQALIDAGVSVEGLMQRAGRGAAQWAWRMAAGRPVTVLCGPGNNGGDGFVIAETLRKRGLDVSVVAPIPPGSDAARAAALAWQGETRNDATKASGTVFVDCLFGTGLNRPLEPAHAALLERLHTSHDFAIAVDVPSGVSTDDGSLLGAAHGYDLTLALGAWKRAHWLGPASRIMGARKLVSIGIERQEERAVLIDRPELAPPGREAHKYVRGLLEIVGGDMPGAAHLAAQAAMRSGAGYVRLFAESSHPDAPAGLVVEHDALSKVLADNRIDALLVGPGLGRNSKAREKLETTLLANRPTVLDGDALTLLDEALLDETTLDDLRAPVVATPHEGELATLCSTFDIKGADKLSRARALAHATGMVVIAKGPDTVVCAPDGRIAFARPVTSWLSVAGSGDCLAGIVASRLATGEGPFVAACRGVWLHGEAARLTRAPFTADDLARITGHAVASCL